MSATDELCKMLDERGVEYTQTVVTEGTLFLVITSEEHYFILVRDNDAGLEIWSRYLTPAQAIAATLGRGECEMEQVDKDCDTASEYMLDRFFVFDEVYKCSCGATFGHSAEDRPRFCPNCGRRVVEVGE